MAPGPLPAGFTARGIVALVFSCLAALLGMATITWYGFAEMGDADKEAEKRRLEGDGNGSRGVLSPEGVVKK